MNFRFIKYIAVFLLIQATTLNAAIIKVNYTADDVIHGWLASDGSVPVDLDLSGYLDLGSNNGYWPIADSFTLDLLDNTTYDIIWEVSNIVNEGQPAGFLAELDLGSESTLSSSSWEISSDLTNWYSAVEFGTNGGSNIWSNVLNGPIQGISTSAQWIWSGDSYKDLLDDHIYIKTTITTEAEPISVPEPSFLILFGSGLIGLSIARRKKLIK